MPFNPISAFQLQYSLDNFIPANYRYAMQDGTWAPIILPPNVDANVIHCYWPLKTAGAWGTCPYFIIKDFTFTPLSEQFYMIEPYSNFEFYIPFVGWVKVESRKFFNQRVLIYYSMDMKTGEATAYIYNYTDQYVIWSGQCQLGQKIDITTTNIEENIKQKQTNVSNMILGSLASAVSIGLGVATENPLAIAGGTMGLTKSIASGVNKNRMIFDRAQTQAGSGTNSLYANKDFKIRVTYNNKINITESVYAKIQGYPYNQYTSLSSLTGYVEIGEIHFEFKRNAIYQDEVSEIVDLLQKGVIF